MTTLKQAAGSLLLTLIASGMPARAAAQEDRVAELEKQLRATQQFFAGEISALQKAKDEKPKGPAALTSDNSEKISFSGYLQARYGWGEGGLDARNRTVDEKSGVDETRVRFKFEGKLDERTDYRFQSEVTQKSPQFTLLDAWVGYQLYGTYVRGVIGQYQIWSQGNGDINYRQFMDVYTASSTMNSELRDRGLFVNGQLLEKKLAYEFQFANGNGISAASHDDTDFRYGVSVFYDVFSRMSLYQNDVEQSPLQLNLASAWARERAVSTVVGHQKKEWLISSVSLKRRGLYVKLLGARQEVDKTAGAEKDQVFGSVQAGYAFKTWGIQQLEPIFRYERLDKNTSASDQREVVSTFGFNYYLKGNASKIQVNYAARKEQGLNKTPNNTFKAGIAIMF